MVKAASGEDAEVGGVEEGSSEGAGRGVGVVSHEGREAKAATFAGAAEDDAGEVTAKA